MKIIITMAGASSRFFEKGYSVPKYMLKLEDKTVFEHSILRYKKLFNECQFIFVIRDIYNTADFVTSECKLIGLSKYKIVCLNHLTDGQAETVYKAMKIIDISNDESVLIGNIDTFSKPFIFSENLLKSDGFLEVFNGDGNHWSFAKTLKNSTRVIKTAEKEKISEHCSTGVYYFKKAIDYFQAFEAAFRDKQKNKNEYYIAPLYNYLIELGLNIQIVKRPSSDFKFCGTPEEYNFLKNQK